MLLLYILAFIFVAGGFTGILDKGDTDSYLMLTAGLFFAGLIVFFKWQSLKTDRFIQWIVANKEGIYNGRATINGTGADEGQLIEPDTKLVQYVFVMSLGWLTYAFHSRLVVDGSINGSLSKVFYTLLTLLFGWWGIPWGPIRTIQALRGNLTGGFSMTPHDLIFYGNTGKPRIKKQPKLVRAAYDNRLDQVYKLLDKGADVHERDAEGRTALHRAAENGNVELLELLLMHGADLHDRDENGNTLLIRASVHGRSEMVRKLLSLGLNPNEGDRDGSMPLVYTGSRGYTNVIRLLLDTKADPNKPTINGTTALMKTVQCDEYWAVRKLLEGGADPYLVHGDGHTTVFGIADQYAEDARLLNLLKGYRESGRAVSSPPSSLYPAQ